MILCGFLSVLLLVFVKVVVRSWQEDRFIIFTSDVTLPRARRLGTLARPYNPCCKQDYDSEGRRCFSAVTLLTMYF